MKPHDTIGLIVFSLPTRARVMLINAVCFADTCAFPLTTVSQTFPKHRTAPERHAGNSGSSLTWKLCVVSGITAHFDIMNVRRAFLGAPALMLLCTPVHTYCILYILYILCKAVNHSAMHLWLSWMGSTCSQEHLLELI